MMDVDDMPVICAGTDTQPPCRHYRAGGCWHPDNLALDVVIGKLRPKNSAEWMRTEPPTYPKMPAPPLARCGFLAGLYEPPRPVYAPAFLKGSEPR